MDYHCISKYVYFDVNIHKNSYASHFHRLIFFLEMDKLKRPVHHLVSVKNTHKTNRNQSALTILPIDLLTINPTLATIPILKRLVKWVQSIVDGPVR